jgi:hypothetical protein
MTLRQQQPVVARMLDEPSAGLDDGQRIPRGYPTQIVIR